MSLSKRKEKAVSDRVMPIMSIGYRADEDIRKLRLEGVTELVIGVPWSLMVSHEVQAQRNHNQTLTKLAERGGLSACEAVAIIEDRSHYRMAPAKANERLRELMRVSAFASDLKP